MGGWVHHGWREYPEPCVAMHAMSICNRPSVAKGNTKPGPWGPPGRYQLGDLVRVDAQIAGVILRIEKVSGVSYPIGNCSRDIF